jgi:CHASE3 domain sensor protein
MHSLWRQRILLILLINLFASIPIIYALTSYRTIATITEQMKDHGLLLYEDSRYLEQYYFSTSKIHDLRNSLNQSSTTAGAIKDLLRRNIVWESEIERVFVVYERQRPTAAKRLAKQTTQTTQTILEDLSRVKEDMYKTLQAKLQQSDTLVATYKWMCLSLSSFLLISATIIFSHRFAPNKSDDSSLE